MKNFYNISLVLTFDDALTAFKNHFERETSSALTIDRIDRDKKTARFSGSTLENINRACCPKSALRIYYDVKLNTELSNNNIFHFQAEKIEL